MIESKKIFGLEALTDLGPERPLGPGKGSTAILDGVTEVFWSALIIKVVPALL